MCSSGKGVPFGVTKPCGRSKSQKLPSKVNNTFDGHCPQKRLFVGEDLFQARKQFVRSGAKGPAWLCFKRHEQFLRLAPTSKKDVPHSCLISLSWRQDCTTTTSKTAHVTWSKPVWILRLQSGQTACELETNPPPHHSWMFFLSFKSLLCVF